MKKTPLMFMNRTGIEHYENLTLHNYGNSYGNLLWELGNNNL